MQRRPVDGAEDEWRGSPMGEWEIEDDDWRRRCQACGEVFPDHAHPRKRFCNKACNNAYFNGLTTTARAENRASLACQYCGTAIMAARRGDRMYCSQRCMWR